jgi:hypothetical protein
VSPFLSIVLTGRNDEHGGDFRARFFRTLAFNLRELAARQISHEIVFVEWAPSSGRPLLVDLVEQDVPEASRAEFSGYVVDPRYQPALSLDPRIAYLEFAAKNVGIRRARGRFVLVSNCDILLGRHVLDVLQREALSPRTLYRAPRDDLKLAIDFDRLGWEVLEDPRNLAGAPRQLKPPLMTGGTGDFILLERDAFFEVRGFNEIYRRARVGVDSNFLVKALSAGIPIEAIGGPVYHVNHPGSYRLRRRVGTDREAAQPWGTLRWHSRGVVYNNHDGWGLAGAPETALSPRTRRLDFSWEAVPPLVDLSRVVLPVARVGGPGPGRYVPQSRSV